MASLEESRSQEAVAADVARLESEGYMVVQGVLAPEECDALREHVLVTSDEAKAQGRDDLFGNIQEQENRSDLKLDLCAPVVASLNSLGARCGPALQAVCGGQVRVVELAAISSSKGAVAQPVHADTMHGVTRFLQSDIALHNSTRERGDDESEDEGAEDDVGNVMQAVATGTALIYTCLLALQDIDEDMGPTHVWPGTHTVEHHATLWSTAVGGKLLVDHADKAFGIAHRKMCLRKGDLVLYDSRTMHCGGPNKSDRRRSVLCISVMGPGIRPDGTTWTMLRSLRNQLDLGKLPLSDKFVHAKTNAAGAGDVELPRPSLDKPLTASRGGSVEDDGDQRKPIPPVADWDACVQCTICRKWRPCGVDEAPKLTGAENGFSCPMVRFSCMQPQGCTQEEMDAAF